MFSYVANSYLQLPMSHKLFLFGNSGILGNRMSGLWYLGLIALAVQVGSEIALGFDLCYYTSLHPAQLGLLINTTASHPITYNNNNNITKGSKNKNTGKYRVKQTGNSGNL